MVHPTIKTTTTTTTENAPEDEDKGKVHPTDETTTQHSRLLVVTRNVEGNGVVEFVRPGDCLKTKMIKIIQKNIKKY